MDRQKGAVVPMNRREFLMAGGASAVALAAPSIVRAGSIMPVSAPVSVPARKYIVVSSYSGTVVTMGWLQDHVLSLTEQSFAALNREIEAEFFRSMQTGTPGGYFLGDIIEMR